MGDVSRRRLLVGLAGAAGVVGTAGCSAGGRSRVRMLVAGSLQQATAETLQERTSAMLAVEAHGSVQAARLVAQGQRDPAILALADPALFGQLLETPWHAAIASNELVLAYTPATTGGRRVRGADRWFDPLVDGDVSLGRTDPTLDPLGYRTMFCLELAATHYGRPDLPSAVLGPEQTYPETQLLAQFETGSIDAAFVYRSMAVERDYPYRSLPAAVNLGDPARADQYAQARYELPDGTVARGAPIEYGATLRTDDDTARSVFETLAAGEWLVPHGFHVGDAYPRYEGDVPASVPR